MVANKVARKFDSRTEHQSERGGVGNISSMLRHVHSLGSEVLFTLVVRTESFGESTRVHKTKAFPITFMLPCLCSHRMSNLGRCFEIYVLVY